MPNSFFKNTKSYGDQDHCGVCLADQTDMCPRSFSYIGRVPHDIGQITRDRICSRFVLHPKKRKERHDAAMEKLSTNL